jgi:hypothetical protein
LTLVFERLTANFLVRLISVFVPFLATVLFTALEIAFFARRTEGFAVPFFAALLRVFVVAADFARVAFFVTVFFFLVRLAVFARDTSST